MALAVWAVDGDKTCKIVVSLPQRMMMNAESADFSLTALTDEGEKDVAVIHLAAESGMLKGEWEGELEKTYAASVSWMRDPHVGAGLLLEPGTISISSAESRDGGLSVKGTELNDLYSKYLHERNRAERMSQRDSIAVEYLKNYGNTPLFVMIYEDHSAIAFSENKEKAETLWALGGEEQKKVTRVLEAYNRICHNDVSNGEPLRDVTIQNATVEEAGKTVKLSDYIGHGKWVFIDFWASWCVACRQAIPLVKEAYEELKDKNILFISIAEWDRRAAALKAIGEEGMPWLQLIDEKGACGSTYMFNTIPRFMLFAPDGTLAEKDVNRRQIKSLLRSKVSVEE